MSWRKLQAGAPDLGEAILLTWSTAQDRMATQRWSRDAGFRESTRTYP